MSASGEQLKTADGMTLNWASVPEQYRPDECDAHLAKTLAYLADQTALARTAERYMKAARSKTAIGKRIRQVVKELVDAEDLLAPSRDRNPLIRSAVARNLHISHDIALLLMNDTDPFVRYVLAGNPVVPELVLRRLSRDPEVTVAQAADSSLLRR